MQTGHGQLGAAAMRALENCEICSGSALSNFSSLNAAGIRTSQNHFPAHAGRDGLGKQVVRIQNDRSIGANSLSERRFLFCNFFAGTHELNVCHANICDDGYIGRRHFCQGRNFTRMVHADLPHTDLVCGGGLQNCSRQADMIIEVSFRFRDSKTVGQHCCCKVLCAGLAVASSDRNHL